MKKLLLNPKKRMQFVLSLFLILVSAYTSWGQGETQTTPGPHSYRVPAGVTSIKIEAWGGGGAGGSASNSNANANARGGGGAGGSYATTTITVIPGDIISYIVGAGATGLSTYSTGSVASVGGFSSAKVNGADDVVKALGGLGGACVANTASSGNNNGNGGAVTSGNIGSTSFYGGSGGNAANSGSGGGGGSAGTASNGNNGTLLGGVAVFGGGAGGNGSNANNAATAGAAGGSPGGGGAGACIRNFSGSAVGGSGGNGKVVISYPIITNTGSFSSLSTVAGVASGSTSLSVTGTDMQSAITATASAGFEVSINDSSFSREITSIATSGTSTFTVYVRLAASATEGTYASGTVTFTGTNAATVTATIPSSTVSSASVAGVTVSTSSLSTSFAKTTAGINSTASQNFTVSGINLGTDAITIAAPTHFKISLTDVDANYSSSDIVLTPSSGTVGTTTIYVKYSPTGTGNISGNSANISITNASVATQTVSVSGSGLNAFYYNSGSLATTGSWKALSNGTGDSPADFTTAGITYTILANATTNASWTVSGTGSKIVVGNGSAVTLTVADTFPITGTIDAAANGYVVWQDVLASPTFGILHSNSEVHLQPTTPAIGLTSVSYVIPGTSFGKLFIDGAAPINLSNGHTVNTLLSVAEGSQLILPTQSSHYIYINTGASATINGTVRSIKKTGVFSFNNTTVNITSGTAIQFKDSGSTLTLSATSTIDYSSINGTQTISALPSGISYANLTLSENSTNITSSSIKAFPTLTITGTLTINTPGNSISPSSTTGAGSITLGDGATIVRTIGTLNEAPTFGSSVNVNYNGNGATQMVGSTTLNSSNVTLTTSNAAIAVGNTVTGIGVPEGTTVASISGTALVLSQNATANANNVTFTIGTAVPQTTGFELPTATSVLNNLTINNPAGVTLGGNVSVNGNLALTAGKLAIGVNTLTLNGSLTSDATNSLSTTVNSNIVLTGTTKTLYFDVSNNTIKNLSITGSNTMTLGNALNITAGASSGIVTVGSGATLTTGGFLTLKSDATGTASLGNSAGTISGNVTVERFIPAKRAWRALTTPLKGSSGTIFTQWQNGGNTITGVGVELWGPGGTGSSGNGLAVGPSSSILQYVSGAWSPVENTKTMSLFTTSGNNAFMVFPTGGYGSGLISSSSTPTALDTTLKATGQLITGQVPYTNLPNTSHTLIGNPYASPLDPAAILTSNTSLGGNIWVWDANTSGTNAVGCYNLFNNGAYTNVTGNLAAGVQIQSGQAFFVKPTSNLASFTIEETHKGTTFSNAVLRTAAPELFRVGLYKQENNEWLGRDGAMTVILPDANANQTPNKMANGTENVAFVKNGSLFASNHHLPLVASDVLNIRVWRTTAGANYKLKINTEQFASTNLNATLEDLFTNSRTPLNLEGTAVEYPFTVTTDALSTGDRFRIVFQNAVLGTNNPTATSFSIVPNPVTGDSFQVNLGTLATGIYTYSIYNAIGQEVEKGSINNATQNTNYEVKMSNSATGIYIMKIKGNDNTVFTAKLIKK
jgi:hypothetical protein